MREREGKTPMIVARARAYGGKRGKKSHEYEIAGLGRSTCPPLGEESYVSEPKQVGDW